MRSKVPGRAFEAQTPHAPFSSRSLCGRDDWRSRVGRRQPKNWIGESRGTMTRLEDRRWHSRVRTHFEIIYSSGREDGSGILADLSYSGALLRQVSIQPRIGSQVRIFVLLSEDAPFEIMGKVVRHVEDGFAIECADLRPELRHLVDDAAARVADPNHVPPRRPSRS